MGRFITFRLADRDFALDATRIRGLLPVHEMLPINPPRNSICGVVSLSGRQIPVADLRGKLTLPPGPLGRRPGIVVVELRGNRLAGFVADHLSDLITVRDREVQAGRVRVNGRLRISSMRTESLRIFPQPDAALRVCEKFHFAPGITAGAIRRVNS